jgi:ribosomal protein S18 acetylase RimI-like enzyme
MPTSHSVAFHPREPPHYYLTLLGTHPDHRGKGIGMRLEAVTSQW